MTKAAAVFQATDSKVAALMNAHDWSQSVLGIPQTWPQPLLIVTDLLLGSKFPMFVAWGPELSFLYNDAYAEILGNKHPTAIGKPFKEIWSELWTELTPIIARVMAGEPSYFENLPVIVNRSGSPEEAWFTFSHSPVRDDKGQIAGIYCAITEMTKQVLAERYMKAESDRLHQLFQQAPGIMTVLSGPDHVYELANEAHGKLVGDREILGKPIRKAFPEIENQGIYELLDNVYSSGVPFVGRAVPVKLHRGPNKELEERFLDFVFQPIKDYQGQVSGIFVEGSDVTESVMTTIALRESENRLKQLANTIPQLAWIADSDGWINWYNDRWYDYTGTSSMEMEGWGWQKVHDPNTLPKVMAQWKHSIDTGETFQMTFPLLSKDGVFHPFFTLVSPLRNDSGKVIQWFGTNTDVTELQKVQDELSESNRRKDEFLAMLAHELRNPLAPLSAASDLLSIINLDNAVVKRTSAVISRQVRHMASLVDDLLDVARVTRGSMKMNMQSLDIKPIIDDAIEQLRPLLESRRHHLTTRLAPDITYVLGDQKRLVQILANLLNNAAKYTPEGGNILVEMRVMESNVLIEVVDEGIGIDKSLQPHIFDLFSQGKQTSDRAQGGLGIGLHLVKKLVQLHEGEVECVSEGVDKGTRFTVILPRVKEPGELSIGKSADYSATEEMRKLRILLVDDNVDAANMLALYLEASGHSVMVEYSPIMAIERAKIEEPDLCILDIGLPEMDGYQLVRKLRGQNKSSQATYIALTGYGMMQDKQKAMAAGFDHHLVKPVDINQLEALMKT